MFIINGIDFSNVAHGCQKWGRPLDPYLLNMNSVLQMLEMCLQIKCRCDDIVWQQKRRIKHIE